MDPYAAKPEDIPATDRYADVPFYGRYAPTPDDLQVDPRHVDVQKSRTREGEEHEEEDSLRYWASVIDLCNESNRLYPADEGGRDVFALGGVVVKSSHLHKPGPGEDGQHNQVDYSYADANEVQATALTRSVLRDVEVPEIYFAGKVNNRQVLVQERIPGVGLNVAWPYLSQEQKESFKQQARAILRRLHTIQPADVHRRTGQRSYVVPDPGILTNGRIGPLEAAILFSGDDGDDDNADPDVSFAHNDFTDSNIIVDRDRIVGVVDWEMAGFFGWRTAGEVHRRIRSPQREHFADANVSEETLRDIMWWNDLYDE